MFRSIASMLLIVALLFPIVEKVAHELHHISAGECGAEGTHFCEQPHDCDLCDQLAASTTKFLTQQGYEQRKSFPEQPFFAVASTGHPMQVLSPAQSLRGPPCAPRGA